MITCALHVALICKDHDLYEPFDFISDEEVEKAFHILAPMLAAFGKKIPNVGKIKIALKWLNYEQHLWPVNTKKKVIHAASLNSFVISKVLTILYL